MLYMNDLDVYLFLVDEVVEEIKKQEPKNKDEVMEIVERIFNKISDKIESALYDIEEDYCVDNGLEWEDEL